MPASSGSFREEATQTTSETDTVPLRGGSSIGSDAVTWVGLSNWATLRDERTTTSTLRQWTMACSIGESARQQYGRGNHHSAADFLADG